MIRKERTDQDDVVLVTFELPMSIGGQRAYLVGDFNAWDQNSLEMERNGNGTWHLSLALRAGRSYQFRYLVDGERWFNDWEADMYVPNPYGGKNSVVEAKVHGHA